MLLFCCCDYGAACRSAPALRLTTLVIPPTEGATAKFLYAMKPVSPKDLGFKDAKCQSAKLFMQVLFSFAMLGNASKVSDADWKEKEEEEEEGCERSSKQSMHFANILEHGLIFLKCMVSEHVFMDLVSLDENCSPR